MTLKNFKGIESLKIDFDKNINVIIGENGSGKSSILFALALALSRFFGRIKSLEKNGLFLTDDLIYQGANQAVIGVEMALEMEPDSGEETKRKLLNWSVSKKIGDNVQFLTKSDLLQKIADAIKEALEKTEEFAIPVTVYYNTNRNALDVPLESVSEEIFKQITTFDGAFNKKNYNDFRHFFEWYRNREDLENEKLRECGGDYRDSQLNAVRNAIESMLPGFSGLKVKRGKPSRMLVTKKITDIKTLELDITQLSDGEKCMLAMVGDIARRLAIANPGSSEPLKGEGIVLIDEIDLHLHPQWENVIMKRLHDIFPNCQFIVTTHSPLVVGSLPSSQIFQLSINQEGKVQVAHPRYSKGLTANEILSSVMGTRYQDQQIQDQYNKLYEAIENGDWENADELINELSKVNPNKSSELKEAEEYLNLSRDDK
jgi:predicted ATP-binding protein involved in virulence